MKRRLLGVVLALFIMTGVMAQKKQLVEQFTLDNGLTVYLWEDPTAKDVLGRVVCRAGAVDEPQDFTGLAHYLEHMLFKGTREIGTLNWEKEAPLYQKTIDLYDQFAASKDEKERARLIKEINKVSMEEAQYTKTDDFSNLTESFGGSGLNAFTSYDLTAYHSHFPSYNMEKWLKLNADRWNHPVFRSFQAELENVFEEYNMYQDNMQTKQREFSMEKLYKGTPYDHDVIGYVDHLKNPSLSPVINFFETWYVPNNMCLMLCGNFNAAEAKPLIQKYFGRLQRKDIPERADYSNVKLETGKTYKTKVGYYPSLYFAFDGPKQGDDDLFTLQFALQLLNNGTSTGMFDKMMLDGDINTAYAYADARREAGRVMMVAVPYYYMAQKRFESNSATRKQLFKVVDKLKKGDYPQWLFDAVKADLLQDEITNTENYMSVVNTITYAFAYGENVNENLYQSEKIKAITREDISRVLNKYIKDDDECMSLYILPGKPDKTKLTKPAIEPLDPPKGVTTDYAVAFDKIPMGSSPEVFNDFNSVKVVDLFDGVKMHYTKNNKNKIFTMTLRYGVGTAKMPKLKYATQLLNTAGVMPNTDAQELRRQFAQLGGSCSFGVGDSYFYISVSGNEDNLQQICQLMTRQALMPKLDNKQIESVISGEINGRAIEKKNPGILAGAVMEYMLYGEKSSFIDRIPVEDLFTVNNVEGDIDVRYLLNNTDLTTTIQEATGYAVDIFFVGQTPQAEAANILKANTPLKETMLPSTSPVTREKMTYNDTKIYFMPEKSMQQAKVYFYINGTPFDLDNSVDFMAFNQYFSGGFSGLVMNEIREKRSMAYTAYGQMATPSVKTDKSYFIGYVGTQSDKVADAVDVYMDLLQNMPNYPERMDNIKSFLHQSTLNAKPSFRSKAYVFDAWKEMGYNDDPAKTELKKIDNLNYENIESFYNQNIKGKPITIIIMGDPKLINLKHLKSKYGKYIKIKKNKLFKGGF